MPGTYREFMDVFKKLMSCPQATLYSFDGESIGKISYKDTAHYKVYKEFFKNN
jgi:predicted ATPase